MEDIDPIFREQINIKIYSLFQYLESCGMWLRLADVLRVKILVQQRSLSIIKACNHLHEAWSLPHADFWFVQIRNRRNIMQPCTYVSHHRADSQGHPPFQAISGQMFSENFGFFCSDFWRGILGGRYLF